MRIHHGVCRACPPRLGCSSGDAPIAQAWKAFDGNGVRRDVQLVEQLHALGREMARGSCQFALGPPTRADAAKAEVELAPLGDEEAKSS